MLLNSDVAVVMDLIKSGLQTKLVNQGHGRKGSSKLIDNMMYDIKAVSSVITASMYMESYFEYIENGVKAADIAYFPGSGNKTSELIKGLQRHWKRQGLNDSEALRASFNTARKWKITGMPTRASFKYSKDGTRLGFLSTTLEKYEDRVFKLLEQKAGNALQIELNNIISNVFNR